jgi:hypothetical protein
MITRSTTYAGKRGQKPTPRVVLGIACIDFAALDAVSGEDDLDDISCTYDSARDVGAGRGASSRSFVGSN